VIEMKNILTLERANELLAYDPETGIIRRKVGCGPARAGDIAGSLHSKGYLNTQIDRKIYRNHRLAWLLHTGNWPIDCIDHINGIGIDNRITNLREATHSQNMQNLKKARSNNISTGLLGVSARGKKFMVRIMVNKVSKYIGNFNDAESAHAAYLTAKREIHERNTL
jgi:hypothetical protein